MFERYWEIREAQANGDEGGFTLIELLIVIVVLGILAAVVVFGLSGITGQSAQSACNADAKSVEVAVEAYHTQQGQWATLNTQLTSPTGARYLRTFPSNPQHYTIALGANGAVLVTPLNGSGGSTNPLIGATDYDNTGSLGPPANSPNPCAYVG